MIEPYSPPAKTILSQLSFIKIFSLIHRIIRGLANNILDKKYTKPREFSNAILRDYAPLFTGSIINVSGWKDSDLEGNTYRKYFSNAESYHISNAPVKSKGVGSLPGLEIEIDLTKPINSSLMHSFDIVCNHTTLEHVFDLNTAFKNLCDMAREVVILIVPTPRHIHFNAGYGDYNRLTPMGIMKYFEKNKFETLVIQSNEQQFSPIFCFAIAARKGSKYTKLIKKNLNFEMGGKLYGSRFNQAHIEKHVNL